jgi:hypothetical protein
MTKPGHTAKLLGGIAGVIAASGALFYAIRVNGKYIYNYTTAIILNRDNENACVLINNSHSRSGNPPHRQQGMGRGYQRIPQEPELQPHLWYLFRGLQGYRLRCQQISAQFLLLHIAWIFCYTLITKKIYIIYLRKKYITKKKKKDQITFFLL